MLLPELVAKRLELLTQAVQGVSRVAVLWQPSAPTAAIRPRAIVNALKSEVMVWLRLSRLQTVASGKSSVALAEAHLDRAKLALRVRMEILSAMCRGADPNAQFWAVSRG